MLPLLLQIHLLITGCELYYLLKHSSHYKNAKTNNIDNTQFYCGDLKDVLNSDVMSDIKKPNIVIVDPPRPGLHPNTVKNLIRLSPEKIIYVSCNPATMARDIEILVSEKYSIADLQPIDMFPHTPHIECVATLILN